MRSSSVAVVSAKSSITSPGRGIDGLNAHRPTSAADLPRSVPERAAAPVVTLRVRAL
jgi:hypothetical protein